MEELKYNSIDEIVNACYSFLESHLVTGSRWGMNYHFYKPANTKYGPFQWLWDSGWHMIVWSHQKPMNAIKDGNRESIECISCGKCRAFFDAKLVTEDEKNN